MPPAPDPLARTLRVRWLITIVPAAIYFVSYFHRVAPAVVAQDLMRAFGITAASLGSLSAIYPYVFVGMALVAGSLADTLGARWTLALGATAMGLGAIVFGLAPRFGVAFGGRFLIGAGASVVLISWLTLASAWFRPSEFGTVSGITQTVGNLGGLVAAAPLARMVDALGWRESFVLIGAGTLVLGVASVLFVRDRPETMGLAPLAPSRTRAPALREVLRGIPPVMTNPRTWPPVLAGGTIFASLVTFQGLWGVPYLMEIYGMPRVEAAGKVALLAVGIVIGAPLAGLISERWLERRRGPFVAFTAVYAACWLPLVVPAFRLPVSVLGPLLFVMGFASCGLVLLWACVREVNDPSRIGIIIGCSNAPVFLCFALLQWGASVVLDARWEGVVRNGLRVYPAAAFGAAFTVCFGAALLALLMSALVTETRCRNVWVAPPVS